MAEDYIRLNTDIDKKLVLRYLGFVDNKTIVPENIWNLIEECIHYSKKITDPQAVQKRFKITGINKNSIIIDSLKAPVLSQNIAALMAHARFVTIMAVTLGNEIDEEIDLLFKKGEYTRASIIDAAASAAAESAAEQINSIIKKEAESEGYYLTGRYSPGYGDFELSYQSMLLTAVKAEKINLQVSSGNMLIPKKSITAVIGWTKRAYHHADKKNKCESCKTINCKYKLTGEQCH